MTKFRLGYTHLPVVLGRFGDISYDERYCTLCNSDNIGDEFHALFECSSLENLGLNYYQVIIILSQIPLKWKSCLMLRIESFDHAC